jgi:DNA-binding SARP family transcriptional activator
VFLDAVWPDEMPDSGRRVLHSLVSRLRGHLGPAAGRLVRDASGYRLEVRGLVGGASAFDLAADELDVIDPAVAAGLLEHALSAWRGDALDEFGEVAPLAAEAVALADLRLDLTDYWIEARLAARAAPMDAADEPAAIVADASRAATGVPVREPTHALLVLALAAAGRQADALRAANDFRRRLADVTDLDPARPSPSSRTRWRSGGSRGAASPRPSRATGGCWSNGATRATGPSCGRPSATSPARSPMPASPRPRRSCSTPPTSRPRRPW